MPPALQPRAAGLKRRLIAKASARQREIQGLLVEWSALSRLAPYPAAQKVRSILQILAGALNMDLDWSQLDDELRRLGEQWAEFACVPFRDATTKNMIIADAALQLGDNAEAARRTVVETSLMSDLPPAWFDAPLFDLDFSSCGELTTPEDDFISLHYHERTWSSWPRKDDMLSWGYEPNNSRAGLTFLVRYFRFGGRKAAYRLWHPKGYRIRFRHDRDGFYFEKLPRILQELWPDGQSEYPYLWRVIEELPRILERTEPDADRFLEAGLDDPRGYYTDVYPR
jgi:hypothetical protein